MRFQYRERPFKLELWQFVVCFREKIEKTDATIEKSARAVVCFLHEKNELATRQIWTWAHRNVNKRQRNDRKIRLNTLIFCCERVVENANILKYHWNGDDTFASNENRKVECKIGKYANHFEYYRLNAHCEMMSSFLIVLMLQLIAYLFWRQSQIESKHASFSPTSEEQSFW